MFRAKISEDGEILLRGRFDAAQVETAETVFNKIVISATVNFKDLEYISSAGLGLLLSTQKRLAESGNSLTLTNMNKHIRDVFRYSGFDTIFEIK